mmetsp:Transcript_22697/g.37362  ORF Transcript_22697/g.37362 Transcript_22697/m.37362 type:complete len:388 (-) Transcript_22697:1156-2319(-)
MIARRRMAHMKNHLDKCGRPQRADGRRQQRAQIGHAKTPQLSQPEGRHMHHDQARQTTGKEHDGRHKNDAQIEPPKLRLQAENRLDQREHNSPKDRAEKEADAAQKGDKQDDARLGGVQVFLRQNFIVDGKERACDPSKKARGDKAVKADPTRGIAQKLGPFGIVAHRIGHAAQGRAGIEVHQDRREHEPEDDEVINLDLLQELDAKERQAVGAVARNAFFAAEKRHDDDGTGGNQLAHAKADHGKDGASLARRKAAHDGGQPHTHQPAKDGQNGQGQPGKEPIPIDDMHAGKPAHTGIDRMAKRQHAALPQQHVVGQRKDDCDRHLVHDRDGGVVGEDEGHHAEQHGGNDPGGKWQDHGPCAHPLGGFGRVGGEGGGHASRFPKRP